MHLTCPLLLASKSPRRQELLRQLGLEFTVRTLDTDESFPADIHWKEVAKYIAIKKARAFEGNLTSELVLTADTVVVLEGKILGKPSSREEAIEMLQLLSGRKHEVITGVAILSSSGVTSFDDTTNVFFRELNEPEIEHYVDTYQPYDKAGAYGIQEWLGMVAIEKIEGNYFNVMGLPVHKVHTALTGYRNFNSLI